MTTEDEDLKTRFRELRAVHEPRTPDLHQLLARRRTRSPARPRASRRAAWKPGWAGAAVVAAAAAMVWLATSLDPRPDAPADAGPALAAHRAPTTIFATGQWSMPTDALLDLATWPGTNLLRDVPEIGTLPAQMPDDAHNASTHRRTPA